MLPEFYQELNKRLEEKGLPRLNWVVAAGTKKPRPGGPPKDTREVRWGNYHTTSWGSLDYF